MTLTEKTLHVVKLSSGCDCDIILMSSPLSTSLTFIPFCKRNQVMIGNGIDLARHVNMAVSPTSSGSVEWGSSVMLTMAAVKEGREGTHKIADVFHIMIMLTYILAVRHHLCCYQIPHHNTCVHYYSHPSVALSLVLLSNPLSPIQKYPVKSSSPVTLTERTLLVVKLSSGCDCDVMIISSPLSTSPTAIPFWNWNQVMVGGGIDLARHVNTAVSPTSTGPVDWGSSVMFTMAAVETSV